jgi:SAM-dependent methyltransferase
MADVVISNCTINHAVDKQAVYSEIHRILRPGGRFVVSDVIAETELPESVRNDPAAWAACYGGAIPEPQYLGAIRGAGFASVEVLQRSEPYEKGGVLVRSLTVRGTR